MASKKPPSKAADADAGANADAADARPDPGDSAEDAVADEPAEPVTAEPPTRAAQPLRRGAFVRSPRPGAPTSPPVVPFVITGPPTRSTQAFAHGKAAAGAKKLQPGFATTPEGDLAFALGFPHVEYIVDNHPDDARAEMIAYERRSYRLGWPRHVAIRWCRITASKGFKRTPQGATELDGAGKKALKNGAPLTADEAALTLKSMFSDTSSYDDLGDLVRLFEAFLGPELVATSIVDALEKSGNAVWNHQDHDRAQALRHVGFLLLRLPTKQADSLRNRLETVFDRRVKTLPTKELGPRKGERGSLLRALDLVLHGRAGAERSGERTEDAIEPADLVHIHDDAEFVREAAKLRVCADPRLAFLGGDAVLEHWLEVFLRLRGLHAQLADNLAEVASPNAVALLQRIAKGKEAAERAQAVLAARGL